MTTEETPATQPQGAWVREVVRDLSARPADAPPTVPADDPVPAVPAAVPAADSADGTEPRPPGRRAAGSTGATALAARRGNRPGSPFTPEGLAVRVRHGESLTHRLARWARSTVGAGGEDARLVELVEAVRRPVTTGRRIAVTGVRGGVGTTTVTLLLGAVFAGRRDDLVLAVDTDPELGALLWRSGLGDEPGTASPRWSDGPVTDRANLDARVPRSPWGLYAVPGSGSDDLAGLGRFFGITLVDCGDDPVGGGTRSGPLADAHAAVLVASATVDGVRAAHLALQAVPVERRQAGAPGRPVVALVPRTPRDRGVDLGRAARYLQRHTPHVVPLPYDRQLAAGAVLAPGRLAERTLLAATELAGHVLAQARQPAGDAR